MSKKRIDFLDKYVVSECARQINASESFAFLPIDAMQTTIFEGTYGNSVQKTAFEMIGINKAGERLSVLLTDIPIFVDVLITDEFRTRKNMRSISSKIIRDDEEILMIPGKEFTTGPQKYIRAYFNTVKDRMDFIKEAHESRLLQTANCDPKYELLLARLVKFNTCNWNVVSNYKPRHKKTTINGKLTYQVETHWKNIVDAQSIDWEELTTMDCIFDKTMICSWDLETYTPSKFGGVPVPENENDKIKMCSMVFRWYWEKHSNLYNVIITSHVIPRIDNIDIIVTSDIPGAMAKVLENMQPDMLTGFNDGDYDWPFIKAKIKDENEFRKRICAIDINTDKQYTRNICAPLTPGHFPCVPEIKIDASISAFYKGYLNFGCIIFDTQIVMRRRDSNETKFKSLNSFLERYGLASKMDMSYDRMARIFHLEELLRGKFKLNSYEKMINYLKSLPPNDVILSQFSDLDKVGVLRVTHYTVEQISEHIMDIDKIATYCLRDAEACIDLLVKINTVSDLREIGSSSKTYFRMGFYNAGGIKVRNMILYQAMMPKWGIAKIYPIAFKIYNGKFVKRSKTGKKVEKKKFPGGYVPEPELGLYLRTIFERRKSRRDSSGSSDPDSPSFNRSLLYSDTQLCKICSITTKRKIYFIGPNYTDEIYDISEYKPEIIKYFNYLDSLSDISYGNFCKNIDNTDLHSRPCAGDDFASLYPSLIMAYNLSPEMYVRACDAEKFRGLGYNLMEIEVQYKEESVKLIPEEHIFKGYFVQHDVVISSSGNTYINHGIFPVILRNLFANRKSVKNIMAEYTMMLEKLYKEFPKNLQDRLTTGDAGLTEITEFLNEKIESFNNRELRKLEKQRLKDYKWIASLFVKHLSQYYEKFSSKSEAFAEFVKNMEFEANRLNVKQNGMKVFMNTFYGEMGNPHSPFFIVEMAGGVTLKGREGTQAAKRFVESKGYHVYYGDTDSIYVSAPEACFAKVDMDYARGAINKLQFFEEMVEITMIAMDNILDQLSLYFKEITRGSDFLKMNYEEVLFPFILLGKKHYVGVKHETSINFSVCSEINPVKFAKGILARGVAIRRRDGSDFVKQNYMRILMKIFDINETRSLEKLIYDEINELVKISKFDINIFKKNCNFAAPRENSHTSQLRFRARMVRLQIIEKANKCASYVREYLLGNLQLREFTKLLNYLYLYLTDLQLPFGKNFSNLENFWIEFEKNLQFTKITIVDKILQLYRNKKIIYTGNLSVTEKGILIGIYEVEVNSEWLDIEISVPQFGSRENIVYIVKPEKVSLRGNRVKNAKGDMLDFPERCGDVKYAKFLEYAEGRIGEIKIDIRCYFEDLFGKLSQFLTYLPEFDFSDKKKSKTQIELKLKTTFESNFEIIYNASATQKKEFAVIKKNITDFSKCKPVRELIKHASNQKTNIKTALRGIDAMLTESIMSISFNRTRFVEANPSIVRFIRQKNMDNEITKANIARNAFMDYYVKCMERLQQQFLKGENNFAFVKKLETLWTESVWRGRFAMVIRMIADAKVVTQASLLDDFEMHGF